jgi:hypothetical protein
MSRKAEINSKYDDIDWSSDPLEYSSSVLAHHHTASWSDIIADFKDFKPQPVGITP